MDSEDLYDVLLAGVPAAPICRIMVGINWTLVEGESGCGLTQTPRRDAPGCQPLKQAGDITKMDLRTAASWVRSGNPMETAIGMAAINAAHNRYDLVGERENGLDAFSDVDGPVTVIGRFPGLSERIKDLRIIEKEPRKGEYPENVARDLIQESAGVIITASTLVNGSATGLLEKAKGKRIALVGPGTPLAPGLFEVGIEILAGSVIEDVDGAINVIAQAGAVRGLKECGRYVTLRAVR